MERYSDKAIEIINELHTARIDYESEYIPLIDCANQCAAYEEMRLTPEELQNLLNQYRQKVEPPVRCKNCKFSHADEHGRTCEGYWFELSEFAVAVQDDDFCSRGEARPQPN